MKASSALYIGSAIVDIHAAFSMVTQQRCALQQFHYKIDCGEEQIDFSIQCGLFNVHHHASSVPRIDNIQVRSLLSDLNS